MLNPDGVAYGSNRCSLAGCDLNRQWKKPSRTLHPTIYYAKAMVRQEKAYRDVLLYVDLHGHSRKMNVFMYGCDDKKKPRPMSRIFPKLLSWNTLGRKYLSFADCSFSMKKGRESTARVVVAKELGIPNAFTLEGTFAGINFGPLQDQHLNGNHFQEMGHAVCDTLLDFYVPNRESNLSEKVGHDGIALLGKVAHATNKGAKTVLLRSLVGRGNNDSLGGGLPGLGEDDDDDDEEGQGEVDEDENDSDDQESGLVEAALKQEANGEGEGHKSRTDDGTLNELGNSSGKKSKTKTGGSRRSNDVDDNAREVPLSPEVVQAAAALAEDAADSPSNRRVLEALAAADVAKNSSPSSGLKRGNSARGSGGVNGQGSTGIGGDSNCDLTDSQGGDGGEAYDEEDEDDGNDVDSGSEDGGDVGDNYDEAEGTAAAASEPNSPSRRESKELEGVRSSPLAMSGQRLLFEATANREPTVAPSADLSPTKASSSRQSFFDMNMTDTVPPAARDGRRNSAMSNVSALGADGSVTCDEGAKGARLPLVPGIGSGNTIGSSGAGSGSSTGSMFGSNGRYRVNRQRSNRSLDGSGEGSVGGSVGSGGGGKEASNSANKGSPLGLAVDRNGRNEKNGSVSLAPTLPAVEFTGMQVRRLSASRSRGSGSGSGSGSGNGGNGVEKPLRGTAAAASGGDAEQDGSSGGDVHENRKSGDQISEPNGSEGGSGTPGGGSSKTISGDQQSSTTATTKSGRSARGSTRKRSSNSTSGSGSASAPSRVGGGMASAAQRLNHRRAGAAQAQAHATGPVLGTLTASVAGTTSVAGVEKYSGRLKAKARRVRKG